MDIENLDNIKSVKELSLYLDDMENIEELTEDEYYLALCEYYESDGLKDEDLNIDNYDNELKSFRKF
ncbi:MAG: hypothetical protein Ta2D_12660 [Rickettsiales bacterium]|nr:MAG: hypothetical protein Ta2D_12660 [Rickettsiales bacterium]